MSPRLSLVFVIVTGRPMVGEAIPTQGAAIRIMEIKMVSRIVRATSLADNAKKIVLVIPIAVPEP
uniref:Uncharacterized protein n=1 Tax=uncultured myxobacterium HF0200_19H16 TaxID=723559 RepID=E7C3X0_9BACT|nr:hypothetical protein [uncultured myxobacterium HF0200_19H16]